MGTKAFGTSNSWGWSPLQLAAFRCQLQTLELMIKFVRSCDHPDWQRLVDSIWQKLDSSEETLFHLACR
jgi:hypothetical protein